VGVMRIWDTSPSPLSSDACADLDDRSLGFRPRMGVGAGTLSWALFAYRDAPSGIRVRLPARRSRAGRTTSSSMSGTGAGSPRLGPAGPGSTAHLARIRFCPGAGSAFRLTTPRSIGSMVAELTAATTPTALTVRAALTGNWPPDENSTYAPQKHFCGAELAFRADRRHGEFGGWS
jgi:hypothetical protein